MKDIMLKIVGTQNVDNDTDTIEFMTEGRIYQKGDATYIVYEESKFSGLEGCKTTVKVSGDKVKMFRFSDGFPVDTQIEFEKGKRFEGYYQTPFGPVEMEVTTNSLTNNLSFEKGGRLNIDYNIALVGLSEGRSVLDIEIMSHTQEVKL